MFNSHDVRLLCLEFPLRSIYNNYFGFLLDFIVVKDTISFRASQNQDHLRSGGNYTSRRPTMSILGQSLKAYGTINYYNEQNIFILKASF